MSKGIKAKPSQQFIFYGLALSTSYWLKYMLLIELNKNEYTQSWLIKDLLHILWNWEKVSSCC